MKTNNGDATTEIVVQGLLRLQTVLKLIPVSKSAWYQGIKEGRFPQPLKLGPRTTVWKAEDVRKLIAHGCDLSRPK
jgi:prophage regulatory protein